MGHLHIKQIFKKILQRIVGFHLYSFYYQVCWENVAIENLAILTRYYLPTPPLGQDMTQGQFLSGV